MKRSKTLYECLQCYTFFLFLVVPVQSVTFTSPSGSFISVAENEKTEFRCVTSEERPRSTILWYIEGNSTFLTGSSVTPADNDTRTWTNSLLHHRFTRERHQHKLFCTANNSPNRATRVSEKKTLNILCKHLHQVKVKFFSLSVNFARRTTFIIYFLPQWMPKLF